MSEWRRYTLEELAAPKANALATGPFGSAIGARFFQDSGVPVIRGNNLSLDVGKRLVEADLVFLSEAKAAEFSRSQVTYGDLVFTCWGTIGQVGLVDTRAKFDRYVVSNKQMKLTSNPDIVDSLYLYYALSSPRSVNSIVSSSIGSSVPGFNLSQLKAIEVLVPPLMEQRAVSGMLGSLDDKIAVNERVAATIDELAAAKFLRLLSEFDDALGWGLVRLGEIAGINELAVRPKSSGHLRYIDISSVSRGRIAWPDLILWDEAPSRARRGISFGDTIWSTVRPGRRSHALVLEQDPDLVASTGLAVITPTRIGPAYLYSVVTRDEFVNYLESVAEGSAYPAVRAEKFADALVPLPPKSLLDDFEAEVMPLRSRAHAAERETLVLAKLRDTLLPKLISGELQIKDAEKAVEGAV